MRRKRLTAEERAIVRHRRFKAFGVDASVGELALCIALFCIADASDMAERVSELAAEGVAFVLREPQRFMDGVGEAIACKAEVLEHGSDISRRALEARLLFLIPFKREGTSGIIHQQKVIGVSPLSLIADCRLLTAVPQFPSNGKVYAKLEHYINQEN